MRRSENNRLLHGYAILVAFTTWILLWIGGLVTSKEAGLAVPDWPTTFGYNMFLFPWSRMVGLVFYEHTHRLIASVVGMMTVILAVWIFLLDSRRWMHWLGISAAIAVIVQGILGGLRVIWLKDEIGIFHACLAQLFFSTLCLIVFFTSKYWNQLIHSLSTRQLVPKKLRFLAWAASSLIFIQLIIGATMRHEHAGLSIPDFPQCYGQWLPSLKEDSLNRINQKRKEKYSLPPTTTGQILLQLFHRANAFLILGIVLVCAWQSAKKGAAISILSKSWLTLILLQTLLGAWTIWSNKAADVATAHVAIGSLVFAMGIIFCMTLMRQKVYMILPMSNMKNETSTSSTSLAEKLA